MLRNKKENIRKNILFYCMLGYSGGGSDHSLYLHLLNLNKERYFPIVIYRKNSNLVKKLKDLKILTIKQKFFATIINPKKIKHLKLPYSKTINFNMRVFIELLILIRTILIYKVDIIHINNNIKTNRAVAIAGILTFRKIILHDRTGAKLDSFDKILVRFVDKVVVISESVKKQYNHLLLNNNIIKIYNGIDISKVKRISSTRDQITIGYLGRFEKWKGAHILVQAIPKIIIEHKTVNFVFAGEGVEIPYIKSLIKSLSIENSVAFLGYVENVSEFYNNIDVFVHTSIEPEPFGRVIIEAMAHGLPVISTKIGGPKEIITNNKDGFLIEPGNPEELTKIINYLIENKCKREEVGREAILTIRHRFDIKITTKNIECLYEF